MYALDFEYDRMKLSDYGMMICSFDKGGGLETVSSGADLTFNTVKTSGSDVSRFYGGKYEESYSMTFQICKNVCLEDRILSPIEISALQRWLCRKDGFHRFKVFQDGYEGIHWNASFSSKQVVFGGQIIGLELTLTTDSPYAYGEEQKVTLSNGTHSLYDLNDEVGYIYPTITVTNTTTGTFELINITSREPTTYTTIELDNLDTVTLSGKNKTIVSANGYDYSGGKFNFIFPRLSNTFDDRENLFVIQGVECEVTFTYCPKIKVGL